MTLNTELDHFAHATPDLDAALAAFHQATGFVPEPGGAHPGKGTRNALVSLGPGMYLAIDGPDPTQRLEDNNGARMATLAVPSLQVFVARCDDLDGLEAVLRERGFGVRRENQSRIDPTGEVVAWEALAVTDAGHLGVAMPVFCRWQSERHPADSAPAGCRVLRFTVTHPDADRVRALYQAIGLRKVEVQSGDAARLTLQIAGPGGEALLRT